MRKAVQEELIANHRDDEAGHRQGRVVAVPCSCCDFESAVGQQFTAKKAAKQLAGYRRGSVGPTTAMLRDGIVSAGLNRGQLLDIGAGIGALTFELLDRGVASAVAVEASRAYLTTAADEAARRRRSESISFVEGDFVDVGGLLPIADVVTLDRVVCCYADYRSLLRDATRHARSGLALSYPRDRWFMRLGIWFENAFRRIRRNAFRTFVHPLGRSGCFPRYPPSARASEGREGECHNSQ